MDRRVSVGPFFNHHHCPFSLSGRSAPNTGKRGQALAATLIGRTKYQKEHS
jgi:hypothetical protein